MLWDHQWVLMIKNVKHYNIIIFFYLMNIFYTDNSDICQWSSYLRKQILRIIKLPHESAFPSLFLICPTYERVILSSCHFELFYSLNYDNIFELMVCSFNDCIRFEVLLRTHPFFITVSFMTDFSIIGAHIFAAFYVYSII